MYIHLHILESCNRLW